jgi:hypothetical protein
MVRCESTADTLQSHSLRSWVEIKERVVAEGFSTMTSLPSLTVLILDRVVRPGG